jgi:hypothetical protein
MRTKKILLLSCLYPLILLLVIGYTFEYTSKKITVVASQPEVNLSTISFTSPNPTTIFLPTNAFVSNESSDASAVETKAEAIHVTQPTLEETDNTVTISISAAVTIEPTVSPTAAEVSPIVSVTSTSSAMLNQNAVPVKSIKIIESASSAIVPAASSVIIESESSVSQ